MIVTKFGGSSIADAERILAVAEIVRGRLARHPVVVVSALAGVTDLLERAIAAAGRDDLEGLEPILADLERRHRWALAGTIESAGRRHDLSLELAGLFEDLRQRVRSMRILGERTPKACDAVLALGEQLSSRIVAGAFGDHGLPARWVDPRQVMITDDRFGSAEPDLEGVREACRRVLVPLLGRGEVPVVGGYVGATTHGETTTIGRGGSDTSAAVIGLGLGADEIQIWTDVDGMMTADPGLVPAARRLDRVSFAEAAELTRYGARVLHPDAVAPAVRRQIPVRVLNSMRPEGEGTLILGEAATHAAEPVAVTCRDDVCLVRIDRRKMQDEPALLSRVLSGCAAIGLAPDLMVGSESGVSLALPDGFDPGRLTEALGGDVGVELLRERAIVCMVGSGLGQAGGERARVLSALSRFEPDLLALGASRTGVAAVIPQAALREALRELHRSFFEEGADR